MTLIVFDDNEVEVIVRALRRFKGHVREYRLVPDVEATVRVIDSAIQKVYAHGGSDNLIERIRRAGVRNGN